MNLLISFFPLSQINDPARFQEFPDSVAAQVEGFGRWIGLTGPALDIVGGLLLLIVGYFVAKSVGRLIQKGLSKLGVDSKTKGELSISRLFGKLAYYLLMIIVLMATLSLMGVSGDVLAPLNVMTAKFLGAIPNIIAAGIIAYVGYFLAKIIAGLVEGSGDKIRSWLPKMPAAQDPGSFRENPSEVGRELSEMGKGIGQIDVVRVLKNVAFIVVFIPILIIALEKLNMQVVTLPATNMLDTFINAIPSIVYAVIILFAAAVGGKFLSRLLQSLLNSLNTNSLSQRLHLENILGSTNLVKVIGNITYIFIVYIGVVEASKQLGLFEVVDILDQVLAVAAKIVFGLLILALGNVVANFVTGLFLKSKNANKLSSAIIRSAILVIFLAMGLHAMGIASDIIELAFGLSLGAIAVAFALAFGIGGREAAGQEVKDFFQKLKKDDKNSQ